MVKPRTKYQNQKLQKGGSTTSSSTGGSSLVKRVKLLVLLLAPVIFILSQIKVANVVRNLQNSNSKAKNIDPDSTEIRKWGCARNETPFIFTHIGKAGGGSVRYRLADAAMDISPKREKWARFQEDFEYYYPMYDTNGTMHRGQLFDSTLPNVLPIHADDTQDSWTYERKMHCDATTILGKLIGCPIQRLRTPRCKIAEFDPNKDGCRLEYSVYMGHNVMGVELNFLPNDFLVRWWKTLIANTNVDEDLADTLGNMLKNRHQGVQGKWQLPREHPEVQHLLMDGNNNNKMFNCPDRQVDHIPDYNNHYEKCFKKKQPVVDTLTKQLFGEDPVLHGAQLMASLPVLRFTVIREPFSWLMSKFLWHEFQTHRNTTNGPITWVSPERGAKLNNALVNRTKYQGKEPITHFVKCDDVEAAARGWAAMKAIKHLAFLCGEHCLGGLADGSLSLQDLERQAAYNLRNSFAVVGILHKTEEFFDMVKQRVFYLDTTLKHDWKAERHATGNFQEAKRCKDLYKQPEFQAKLIAASPEIAALQRMYELALEVNEFQHQELQQCSAK